MAADLKPGANQAYDRYTREVEARFTNPGKPFLWIDSHPDLLREVKEGQVVVQPWKGNGDVNAPGALMHDWIGAVFIPGVTMAKVLAVMQDYDQQKNIYKDTLDSKMLSHNDDTFTYNRVRQLKKGIIDGIFYTQFDAHYRQIDPERWICVTLSTKVNEIENYKKSNQRDLPVGKGSGYLWRLDGFYRLEQRDNGVYLECEAVSLTRSLPALVGGLFAGSMHDLEKEGLEMTLQATRDAAKK
jgi:hypothetical protein